LAPPPDNLLAHGLSVGWRVIKFLSDGHAHKLNSADSHFRNATKSSSA